MRKKMKKNNFKESSEVVYCPICGEATLASKKHQCSTRFLRTLNKLSSQDDDFEIFEDKTLSDMLDYADFLINFQDSDDDHNDFY